MGGGGGGGVRRYPYNAYDALPRAGRAPMASSLFSSISSSGSSASSASDRSALLVLGRAPPRSYGSLLTYQFLKSARSLRQQQVTPGMRRVHGHGTTVQEEHGDFSGRGKK